MYLKFFDFFEGGFVAGVQCGSVDVFWENLCNGTFLIAIFFKGA